MTDEVTPDPLDPPDDEERPELALAKVMRKPGMIDMIMGQPVPQILGLLIEAKRRVGAVGKGEQFGKAGQAGSYKFRGVDQVTNAVAGVFIDLGILVSPEVLESKHDVYENVRDNGSIQRAFHHILRVKYTFTAAIDASTHSVVVEGESIDYSDKGTAQTMSVAMRVALLQALTLPTDEPDPDSMRNEITSPPREPRQPRPQPPAPTPPAPVAPTVEIASTEDHDKLTTWLKEQTKVVQDRAKTFIHSQAIPLARKKATLDQLNQVEAYAREVADETRIDS